MRTILREDILTALSAHGAIRGSDSEFASVFGRDEAEISECLLSMVKEGWIHRATGLGANRSVYSLTREVVSAPAYRSTVGHTITRRAVDALPL